MEMPHVDNIVEDAARNARYVIKAYRFLTKQEMMSCIAHWRNSGPGRKPRPMARNQVIIIVTVIS
jgi:hypothetical protein